MQYTSDTRFKRYDFMLAWKSYPFETRQIWGSSDLRSKSTDSEYLQNHGRCRASEWFVSYLTLRGEILWKKNLFRSGFAFAFADRHHLGCGFCRTERQHGLYWSFTFNAVRNIIGAIALLPVIWGLGKTRSASEQTPSDRKTLITGGICCGILLCLASNFQQFGIKYTTVGKAGFITACYIIIVPVIGIFLKKKCSPFIWIAVILSLCGLYLLCLTPGEGFAIGKGRAARADLCSTFFPAYPVIDHFLTFW